MSRKNDSGALQVKDFEGKIYSRDELFRSTTSLYNIAMRGRSATPEVVAVAQLINEYISSNNAPQVQFYKSAVRKDL